MSIIPKIETNRNIDRCALLVPGLHLKMYGMRVPKRDGTQSSHEPLKGSADGNPYQVAGAVGTMEISKRGRYIVKKRNNLQKQPKGIHKGASEQAVKLCKKGKQVYDIAQTMMLPKRCWCSPATIPLYCCCARDLVFMTVDEKGILRCERRCESDRDP